MTEHPPCRPEVGAEHRAPHAPVETRGTDTAGPCTAWVESPFQVLGVIEAYHQGHLPAGTRVVPRAGILPLEHTISTLRDLGLPDGLRIGSPAPAPPRTRATWVVGDPFSGVVQQALVRTSPERLVLVDDGRSTQRVLHALAHPRTPMVRAHATPAPVRSLLGLAATTRLRRLAHHGRLHVISALRFREPLATAARRSGVQLSLHHFAWLRSRPTPPPPPTRTVVLGTSLVANGLIHTGPYLDWITALAATEPLTYLPHRREDPRTLGVLERTAGVDLHDGDLPVELTLRGLRLSQQVTTLPSTAASTLPLIVPGVPVHERAVPGTWWTARARPRTRRWLVPSAERLHPAR